MRSVLRVVDATNEWCGKIISFLIVSLIGVVVWEVVLRYAFNSPTSWSLVTSQRILLIYVLLGGGYALRTRAHVNMDILYRRFSPRRRAMVDLVTSTLFFLFCAGMLWGACAWMQHFLQYAKLPPNVFGPLGYPINVILFYPASLWAAVAAFLMLLQGLAKFIRDLATAIAGKEAV